MLQLQDITLHRGDRMLFNQLNLVVHAGQHVSLVGSNGFAFSGSQSTAFLGHSVSTAGDVNRDGYDDLIVGAWTSPGPKSGN